MSSQILAGGWMQGEDLDLTVTSAYARIEAAVAKPQIPAPTMMTCSLSSRVGVVAITRARCRERGC